jgi:hypothetical protein
MNTWPRPPATHGLFTARTIQTKKTPLIVTTAISSHRYRSYRSARARFQISRGSASFGSAVQAIRPEAAPLPRA